MLAVKRTNPERVFVPIVPMHISRPAKSNSEQTMQKMIAKNAALQSLIAAFDLAVD